MFIVLHLQSVYQRKLAAVSIGLLQSKETPKMVASVQDLPRNGVVVASFGGIRNMKTFKDAASEFTKSKKNEIIQLLDIAGYFRTIVAFAANMMLFVKVCSVLCQILFCVVNVSIMC